MLVFTILFTFVFGVIRVSELAMEPAVKNGDLIMFFRLSQEEYQPGEIIVVRIGEEKQIRRVVAIAGDVVDITEAGLVINGDVQQEPGIYWPTLRYQEGVNFPITVPQGQFFVLGDNRLDVTDSRIYGCVTTEEIMGKLMTIIRRRNF